MFYIKWYQTNWFYYLPIIILFILIVICLLRIIRRITRWKPVSLSHVKKINLLIENETIIVYFRKNPEDFLNEKKLSFENVQLRDFQSILLIPPLSINIKKNWHVAVALAASGYNIFTLEANQLLKCCNPSSTSNIISSILKKYNIHHLIAFDYSIPLLIHKLIENEINRQLSITSISDFEKITWIFIRPTWSWCHIKNLRNIIPFSSMWWARLFLLKFKRRIPQKVQQVLNNLNSEKNSFELFQKVQENNPNIFLILSHETWLNKEGMKLIKNWEMSNKNSNFIKIPHSNWSFSRQETVVFGWMNYLINLKKND